MDALSAECQMAPFTTPNYPDYYPNNMSCVYFIEVGGDFLTTITFKYFYLENSYDYLYIGIGTNTQQAKHFTLILDMKILLQLKYPGT